MAYRSIGGSREFAPQWSMELTRQDSTNDKSISHDKSSDSSQAFPNYDIPKPTHSNTSLPALTPKKSLNGKRMVVTTPCACDGGQPLKATSYENYDIPKHISQVNMILET